MIPTISVALYTIFTFGNFQSTFLTLIRQFFFYPCNTSSVVLLDAHKVKDGKN